MSVQCCHTVPGAVPQQSLKIYPIDIRFPQRGIAAEITRTVRQNIHGRSNL